MEKESLLIIAHHVETSHMKNNIFASNFTTRGLQEISLHVESALAKSTRMSQGHNSPLAYSNFDGARTGTGPKQLVGAPALFSGQVYMPDGLNLLHNTGNADLKQKSAILTPPVFSAPGSPAKLSSSLAQITPSGSLCFGSWGEICSDLGGGCVCPPDWIGRLFDLSSRKHCKKMTYVICEICDGYIQNMEQLRKHLYWIHKINIHPKMMSKRPPLSCEKCQFRFFTDQGLERHLLGSHGLVTTSMQQAALREEDSGRCPTCARVYKWKLLQHMTRDHGIELKPAQLSYKCSICSSMFTQYKKFAKHVYCTHKTRKTKPNEGNNNFGQ